MAENPISYDVDADKKLRNALLKAARSGLDLSFSMGESARIVKKESTKNFILKGSGQYPPLSAAYQKRKQRLAPGTPILSSTPNRSLRGFEFCVLCVVCGLVVVLRRTYSDASESGPGEGRRVAGIAGAAESPSACTGVV